MVPHPGKPVVGEVRGTQRGARHGRNWLHGRTPPRDSHWGTDQSASVSEAGNAALVMGWRGEPPTMSAAGETTIAGGYTSTREGSGTVLAGTITRSSPRGKTAPRSSS